MSQIERGLFRELDEAALELVSKRKRPLLALFYDENDGWVGEADVPEIYKEFRRKNWAREQRHDRLDVLLHTLGGDPDAGYRIAQVIRDFASSVTFLVPEYATSAGTLICLCANRIRMGAYATLGPIDITFNDVELASIEYFKRFSIDCAEGFLQMLQRNKVKGEVKVGSELLVELAKQVTAIDIGSFYRSSDLTVHYAKRLMLDYMFSKSPNKELLANAISERLLRGFPSHDFALDYHMCKEMRLPVVEMDEEESELTKGIVSTLDELVQAGAVCRDVEPMEDQNVKAPFIRLYERKRLTKSRGATNAT